MKTFLALTILFVTLAMQIDIDTAPGDHSGHVAANVQLGGN